MFILACAVLCACSCKNSGPIPLSEVYSRSVAGELGLPFGTIVRIHGTAFLEGPPGTPRIKEWAGAMMIRVDQLQDRLLSPPILVVLSSEQGFSVADRRTVTLIGYETGFYRGIVDGESDYGDKEAGIVADHEYGFETRFVVLKVENVETTSPSAP